MASNESSGEGGTISSKFPKEKHRFTWEIADFEKVQKSQDLINATEAKFEIGQGICLPVTLRAFLRFYKNSNPAALYVEINVEQAQTDIQAVVADIRVIIEGYVDTNNGYARNLLIGNNPLNLIPQYEYTRGYQTLKPVPLDKDGNLKITIEVTVYNTNKKCITIPDLLSKFQACFLQNLAQDLQDLQAEPYVSAGAPDVVKVVSKDGMDFRVNWLILAARSPVFYTMFQTPMSEVKEGVIKMDDISGNAVKVILGFLHTGSLKENWMETEVLVDVIRAAHRYMLKDLLEFLESALDLLCTTDNCVQLLCLSQTLGLQQAKKLLWNKYLKQTKGPEDMLQLFKDLAIEN